MLTCRCCKAELSDAVGYSVTESKCWNCKYGRTGAEQMREQAEILIADSFCEYGEAAMDSEPVDVQGEFDEWLDDVECVEDVDFEGGEFDDDDADYDDFGECDPSGGYEHEDGCDPGDMDGDWDSGMASAGWGTDEDYGDFDGECDF